MICHWATNRTDPQNLLSTTLDVPLQTPPKQSSVKIEEVEDDEDKDIEMHSPSPPPPKAGPLQYTSSQVPTVIPQK